MKMITILMLSLSSLQGFGQITSIWKGRTPGHEYEWHCAGNWSNNRLPDDFTDVFIPIDNTRSFNYPIIKSGEVVIHSLHMHADAIILIRKGTLTIIHPDMSQYLKSQVRGIVKTEKRDADVIPGNTLTSNRFNKF